MIKEFKALVLVIEDDKVLLDSLIPALKEGGFRVTVEADGIAGLKSAIGNRPDVILLDLGLPKMDGLTVFSKLREDGWGKDAKVIIFSVNDPDRETLDAVNKLKPAYYLVKSNWSLDEVVKRLKEVTKTM